MSGPSLELHGHDDLIRARIAARELASHAGLGLMDQTRFTTAVSELVANALLHASGGICELDDLSEPDTVRVQARISDRGPGIADLDQAMQAGFSTGRGLGEGLLTARKIADQFAIESTEAGTRVRIQIVRRRAPRLHPR